MQKLTVSIIVLAFLLFSLLSSTSAQVSTLNWTIQTAQQGNTRWLSFALDANDNPCIGSGNSYVTWNGSDWVTEVIDPSGWGYSSSLVVDLQGDPHVCYGSDSGLKYASLIDSEWVMQTVDLEGGYPSLVLDKAGNPHISYQDRENLLLKYAVWTGSGWSIESIDSTDIADSSCIALDSNDTPHICYSGGYNGTLRHAFWNSSAWIIEDVDPERAWSISLKVDAQDNLHLCYTVSGDQRGLKYATLSGSDWVIQMVDPAGWVASLALDSAGNPCVAYEDTSFYVKFTKLGSSGWSTQSIDKYDSTSGMRNGYISIVLDSSENPHVIYLAYGSVKYAFTVLNPVHSTNPTSDCALWTTAGVTIVLATILLVTFFVAAGLRHKK
jgi:hypothetical protein